jgi:hypothetical protein
MLSKSFKAQELLGFRISDFTQAKHFGCQEICFPCRDEYLKGRLPRSPEASAIKKAPGSKDQRIHKEKAKSSEAKFGRRHCLAMTLGDLLQSPQKHGGGSGLLQCTGLERPCSLYVTARKFRSPDCKD